MAQGDEEEPQTEQCLPDANMETGVSTKPAPAADHDANGLKRSEPPVTEKLSPEKKSLRKDDSQVESTVARALSFESTADSAGGPPAAPLPKEPEHSAPSMPADMKPQHPPETDPATKNMLAFAMQKIEELEKN